MYIQMHMKMTINTPINTPILAVDIVLGKEKRKTQVNYIGKPKEPPTTKVCGQLGITMTNPLTDTNKKANMKEK
jgi:hypothetical protein